MLRSSKSLIHAWYKNGCWNCHLLCSILLHEPLLPLQTIYDSPVFFSNIFPLPENAFWLELEWLWRSQTDRRTPAKDLPFLRWWNDKPDILLDALSDRHCFLYRWWLLLKDSNKRFYIWQFFSVQWKPLIVITVEPGFCVDHIDRMITRTD